MQICLPLWTTIASAAVLLFAAPARRMGHWVSLIYLNVAAIVGTLCIPLAVMATDGVGKTRASGSEFVAVSLDSAEDVVLGLGLVTFGLTGQFMVVEIMAEMKDVSSFPSVYNWLAAPFQAVAYLGVGLGE